MRGKITMQRLLRATAVLIFIIGAGVGWDLGDKQIIDTDFIFRNFDIWLALLSWLVAFAAGLLFLAAARILDLLENGKQ